MKIDSQLLVKFRNHIHPLLIELSKLKVKYKIEIINEYIPVVGMPIIFSVNHQDFRDAPITQIATKCRSYIYAGKQKLYWLDWLFFVLNGVIWVDRKDKRSKTESKGVLIEYLKKGQTILWFPEDTWNLTDNLLVMEMKWGIIDVAYQANAQIIPVALYYDRTEEICRVKFGEPILGDLLKDKAMSVCILRDTMASLYYDVMSEQTVLHRENITISKLREEVYKAVEEYPPFDLVYESSCIYHSTVLRNDLFSG